MPILMTSQNSHQNWHIFMIFREQKSKNIIRSLKADLWCTIPEILSPTPLCGHLVDAIRLPAAGTLCLCLRHRAQGCQTTNVFTMLDDNRRYRGQLDGFQFHWTMCTCHSCRGYSRHVSGAVWRMDLKSSSFWHEIVKCPEYNSKRSCWRVEFVMGAMCLKHLQCSQSIISQQLWGWDLSRKHH